MPLPIGSSLAFTRLFSVSVLGSRIFQSPSILPWKLSTNEVLYAFYPAIVFKVLCSLHSSWTAFQNETVSCPTCQLLMTAVGAPTAPLRDDMLTLARGLAWFLHVDIMHDWAGFPALVATNERSLRRSRRARTRAHVHVPRNVESSCAACRLMNDHNISAPALRVL